MGAFHLERRIFLGFMILAMARIHIDYHFRMEIRKDHGQMFIESAQHYLFHKNDYFLNETVPNAINLSISLVILKKHIDQSFSYESV